MAALPAAAEPGQPAPLRGAGAATAIDGHYIVVMKEQSAQASVRSARADAVAKGAKITHTYSKAVHGFAAKIPDRALASVRNNPNVAYVELDQRVTATGDQDDATWGIDRTDQRDLPLDQTYHYDQTGTGVTAYIIDTGLLASHSEFTGRTAEGFSSIEDGGGTTDCNGHGTHVSGTVGGTEYGIAKEVTIKPVRVLDCEGSGTTSGVIAGIDWVTSDHADGPAVANMSLGGGASDALDDAVASSIDDGVVYSVAAGNESSDACGGSPSRVEPALTVGATDDTDSQADFSNYGSCVDLYAPGVDITSAWIDSDTATNTISGTSMATPHVTGVAALYLEANPGASSADVAGAVVDNATPDVVTNPGSGSPNLLLHSLW